MHAEINYDSLAVDLGDTDETIRLEAIKQILKSPLFEEREVSRFLGCLSRLQEDPSVGVRFFARKAFSRLKRMARNRDLEVPEPESGAERKAPTPGLAGSQDFVEQWLSALESTDPATRIEAIIELANSGDERAYQQLLQRLDHERHPHVVATLVKYIGHFHRPDCFFKLKGFLNHPDTRVRANVIEGFQILADPRAMPLVLPLLKDVDNRIRANAAKYLLPYHPTEVVRSVKSMLSSHEEWMRLSALHILATVEIPSGEELILDVLADPSEEVAEAAIQALGVIGRSPQSEMALERLAGEVAPDSGAALPSSRRIREAAVHALEEMRSHKRPRRPATAGAHPDSSSSSK